MAHSPLVSRKQYNQPQSGHYGGVYREYAGYKDRYEAQSSLPGGNQARKINPPRITSRLSTGSFPSKSHGSSTIDRKGPMRADHNIVKASCSIRNDRQKTLITASSLNRHKSSSLNNLSSTPTKYRTLHDRISSDGNNMQDSDSLLRNARMKLDKLNENYRPLGKALNRHFNSMSDISTSNSANICKRNIDHVDNSTAVPTRQKSATLSRTSSVTDLMSNRRSVDASVLRSNTNISSGSEKIAPKDIVKRYMSSESIVKTKSVFIDGKKLQKYGSGTVGLRNLGNTCFMNSILQCLCKSKELRSYFFNKNHVEDINENFKPTRGQLTLAFADLIQEMWSSPSSSSISPSHLKSQVGRFAPRFTGTHQHDSQEFLRFFIEGIHDELNSVKCKPTYDNDIDNEISDEKRAQLFWERYLSRENSFIQGLFVGQLRSTLKCSVCNHCSVTYDPFWDLSLPIPTWKLLSVNISDCFKMFTQEEVLDGEEKPTCEKCKKRRKCTKQFSIEKYPTILVIHLKRFSGQRFRTKLSSNVVFPMELNLREFVFNKAEDAKNPPLYQLFGVSNHMGGTGGGHYTACCKHPDNNRWHLYNDSRVTEVSSSNAISSSAYVLFYSLKTSDG